MFLCALSWLRKHSTATWCENITFTALLYILSQADAIYNMVGYPDFIMNATNLDKVFNDVGKCGVGVILRVSCHSFPLCQYFTCPVSNEEYCCAHYNTRILVCM